MQGEKFVCDIKGKTLINSIPMSFFFYGGGNLVDAIVGNN
jgi:hypothetical protein